MKTKEELGKKVKAFNDWLETLSEEQIEKVTNIISIGEEEEIEDKKRIEQLKKEMKEVNKLCNAVVKCQERMGAGRLNHIQLN